MAAEIVRPGFFIAGTGRYLPDPGNPVTNEQIAELIEQDPDPEKKTTPELIYNLSHIETRHFARDFETTAYMGMQAANQALERSGLEPEQIDLVIAATFTPDKPVGPVSADIAGGIGAINARFFDLNAACSSFLIATIAAHGMMRPELKINNVVVVGVDRMSGILDEKDRNTAFLFGDYSGAVIYSFTEHERGIVGMSVIGDSSQENRDALDSSADGRYIAMPGGRQVRKLAERTMVATTKEASEMAKITPQQIGMYVIHQANGRIIDGVVKKSGVSEDTLVPSVIEFAANGSSATLPFALDYQLKKTGFGPKKYLGMTTAGAGIEAGSIIMYDVINHEAVD